MLKLCDVVAFLAHPTVLRGPIFKQLIWATGDLLDEHIVQVHNGVPCEVVEVGVMGERETGNREARCPRYWQAAAEYCSSFPIKHLSGSIDKSRVHSFGLVNGVFGVPNGTVWWAVPQDSPLSFRRLGKRRRVSIAHKKTRTPPLRG